MRIGIALLCLALVAVLGCGGGAPSATPAPTATTAPPAPTATSTPLPTNTPMPAPTDTPQPTAAPPDGDGEESESEYIQWVNEIIVEMGVSVESAKAEVPIILNPFGGQSWCENVRTAVDALFDLRLQATAKAPPAKFGPFHTQLLVSLDHHVKLGQLILDCADSGEMSLGDFSNLASEIRSAASSLSAAIAIWPSSETPPPALQ